MSYPKVGPASSSQVSSSPNSVQGGTQLKGLEGYQGFVDDVAQHLASDPSLRTPGQLHEQAQSALQELTGLEGSSLQRLVGQTLNNVNDIRLSSGDRWLHSPTPKPPPGDPGDSYTPSSGSPQSGKPILL
jgi:hypothetical protein